MINLSAIKPHKVILPPRITLYGPEKIGKTTFASQIPDTLMIDIEGGSGALSVHRIMRDTDTGMLTTFASFLEVLDSVEKQSHDFRALVIDSLDWLENLVFQNVATAAGKPTIADIGYGAGHVAAENIFRDIFRRLDKLRTARGMAIILLAHCEIVRFDHPLTASFDQYRLKLHKRIAPLVNEWSDALLFATLKVQVKKETTGMASVNKASDQGRVIYTGKSEAYIAGNRYDLSPILPLSWDDFIEDFNRATSVGEPSGAA